jgi:hypothetical protein
LPTAMRRSGVAASSAAAPTSVQPSAPAMVGLVHLVRA